MINCGHCKGRHATVAAVKVCAGQRQSEGGYTLSASAKAARAANRQMDADEAEMQRMEAEADRAQTAREELDKARFKAETERYSSADRERAEFERGMRNRSVAGLKHEIRELLATKEIPQDERRWADAIRRYLDRSDCTEFALKNAIHRLNDFRNVRAGGYPAASRAAVSGNSSPDHEGLYRLSRDVRLEGVRYAKGTYVQVMRGKDSMKLYAKIVHFAPEGSRKRPELQYVRGLIFNVLNEELLPVEEAEEITRKTGWCIFGHFLTNPKSIARGMGPKCYERYPHLARNVA